MDIAQILPLLVGRPESYAILVVILIFGWKYFPVLKKKVEMQQSQLEGDVRRERLLQDIVSTLNKLNSSMQTLATKDDVIEILLHKPAKKTVLNGSGSIAKQGV